MTKATGQKIRLVAYVVEAIAMVGLLSASRQTVEPRRFAGLDPGQWSLALATGLALWILGTLIFYWPRKTAPSHLD